jgi:hypothetical protein
MQKIIYIPLQVNYPIIVQLSTITLCPQTNVSHALLTRQETIYTSIRQNYNTYP